VYQNDSNATVPTKTDQSSTKISSNMSSGNIQKVGGGVSKMPKNELQYDYSPEYGRSILTDVRIN